jgi:hypothetical protein
VRDDHPKARAILNRSEPEALALTLARMAADSISAHGYLDAYVDDVFVQLRLEEAEERERHGEIAALISDREVTG